MRLGTSAEMRCLLNTMASTRAVWIVLALAAVAAACARAEQAVSLLRKQVHLCTSSKCRRGWVNPSAFWMMYSPRRRFTGTWSHGPIRNAARSWEATAFPVRISNSKDRVVEKAEMFSGFSRLLIEWAP